MIRLKRLLSQPAKCRRHQRNVLNIMTTFLAWLVEFLGFCIVILGTHILGHQNNIINLCLQTLTNIFYFIFIPLALLVNDSDFKSAILKSTWYGTLLTATNLHYVDPNDDTDIENGEADDQDDRKNKKILAEEVEKFENTDNRVETFHCNNPESRQIIRNNWMKT